MVSNGTVSPSEGKIEAIRAFAQPKTKKQVRQYIGLTGYYRRFVEKYAEHSFHHTEATKMSAPERVVWSDDMYNEFCYLKQCLVSLPTLSLPLSSDSFILQTDASQNWSGCSALSAKRGEEELPVAF